MKRKIIFSQQNYNIIKEQLDINTMVNILCDMKNMSHIIIKKSPNVKYIRTILWIKK